MHEKGRELLLGATANLSSNCGENQKNGSLTGAFNNYVHTAMIQRIHGNSPQ